MKNELSLGHTPGPHPRPPFFPEFMCSPIGNVPRKNCKWRVILDLSAPADFSVNKGIARESFSV